MLSYEIFYLLFKAFVLLATQKKNKIPQCPSKIFLSSVLSFEQL